MLGLGKKSSALLAWALIIGIWASRKTEIHPDYWEKIPRFAKIHIEFDTPQPREQSVIFQTAKEIIEPIEAKPSGEIPHWLKGTLLKNGPGLFEFGDQNSTHLFDGMAMVRRYHMGKYLIKITQ